MTYIKSPECRKEDSDKTARRCTNCSFSTGNRSSTAKIRCLSDSRQIKRMGLALNSRSVHKARHCKPKLSFSETQGDVYVKNKTNEKRIDQLMAAITLYTTQLEDYDKSNFNACMTCIGFVGGLIAVVGTIICTSSNNNNVSWLNEAVAVILLLIPLIITLFLYNFSMNCRRSSLFRGYTQFLEECLNKELERNYMLYSNFLIPKHYSAFPVNKFGPIALMIFLLFLYAFSIVISLIFAQKSGNKPFICGYYIGLIFLIIPCTLCDLLYVVSLAKNDKIIKKIKKACMDENNI